MKKILISTSSFATESSEPLDRLKEAGIEYLINPLKRKLTPEETIELMADKDGVIAGTESYPKSVLDKLPKLKVISRCGAGTDGIDKVALKAMNISLFNTPQVHVTAVAELTISGLLALSRKIVSQHQLLVAGKWEKKMGVNISHKTVGIIGFGKVGQAVARMLNGFSCKLLICDPFYPSPIDASIGQRVNNLDEIWSQSDIISLHIPSTSETKGLLNSDSLAKMKSHVLILNTSRGDLIHEEALYEFLVANPSAGAYLDVFDQEPYAGPLTQLSNVVLTPHVGTFTLETRTNMELESAINLINYFKNNE
ncbi:MAG: phosphoglycerate dehydrogenase [Cyclobacteriaceae bacterium]|nr:phosphoglycerate dehydrogenase [Cyclobacteriaceae bacterium]